MSLTPDQVKVAFIFRDFQVGGTERQVLELAKHLNKSKYDVHVIVLRPSGGLREGFEALPGVHVVILHAARSPVATLTRLLKAVRRRRIEILHSFSSATNVYSLFAKMLLPRMRVIVGLRNALEDSSFGHTSLGSRAKIRALDLCVQLFGSKADLFISNSGAGKNVYKRRFGFEATVIPNGVDIVQFKPDKTAGVLLRQAIGAPEDARIVGMVANCSAYKDYPTFIRAARFIADTIPNIRFVAIGDDHNAIGFASKQLVTSLSLESIFHFMGTCSEVHKWMPGFDVLCSSSSTEGFSNAIAEAMACGIPCVVTDVGDSREIVGDSGLVVPPGKPEELGSSIIRLLSLPAPQRHLLCLTARERTVQKYGISQMIARHESIYDSLAANRSEPAIFASAEGSCSTVDLAK